MPQHRTGLQGRVLHINKSTFFITSKRHFAEHVEIIKRLLRISLEITVHRINFGNYRFTNNNLEFMTKN